MARGRPTSRAAWPSDGPHLTLLKFLDRVHAENGTKSQRQIADGMHLKARSRVNDLLRGRALPADERQVDALVRALGGGDDEVSRAIRLYRAAAADRDKRSVPAALRRDPARQRPLTVDAWSPFLLGVHRAITVDLVGGTALPDLPRYVMRDLDHELDDLLDHVVNNLMIVLVGGSSTGKTRAAYEAVRRNFNGWSLVHPATRDELLELLASDALGPRTIVWLNETQSYLQDDGRVAASLRRVLASADRGPIVVMGSMWSTYWKELTDDKQRDSDRHHQARELLLHAVRRVTVPETFSSKDLAALREQQAADPRLTVASERCGSSGRVVQVLAGGPALVQRFEEPADAEDRYGRAVVTAAMDCRVLGQHGPITDAYLAEVTAAYLSPEDRASAPADWFDIGLAHATRTIHGIAALAPHRDLLTAGPAHGYLLHDYLFQHAQQARRHTVVPAPVWNGLVTHASLVADRARLALEAHERQLLRHALELALPASEAGDDDAMWLVAATLATAGFVDEAEEQWKRIVASGHPDGLGAYVEFLDDQDRDDDALMVLLDAAEAGDVGAMAMLGYRLSHGLEILWEGSAEAAEHWLRRAGEAGVLDAWLNLADLLERHGHVDAAENAMFSALTTRPTGNTRAIRFLAEWLTKRERPDAERWTRMADRREEAGARRALLGQLRPEEADDGLLLMTLTDAHPIWRMVQRLASKGERVEADRLLRHAILTGELGNVGQLVDNMQETGRGDEVEEWLRSGLSNGNPAVITCLCKLLRDSGRPDEAIQVLRDATAFVDGAAWMLARHLELAGRMDEAEQIWRRLIDREPGAIHMLIRLLEKTGRMEEASYLTSTLPDREDNDDLIAERVEQLVTAGRADEAEQWLRRRTEDGASAAGIQLAWFLREHGRTEEADRYIRFGIEPGGQTAAPWSPPDSLTQ